MLLFDIKRLTNSVNSEIKETKRKIAYYENIPEYDFFRRIFIRHLKYLKTLKQLLLDEKLHLESQNEKR